MDRHAFGAMSLVVALWPAALAAAPGFEVSRFAEVGDGSVNTWILEADETIVVIDTRRTLSVGREAASVIAKIGKPLAAILPTHPHPDHFGGLQSFLDAFPGTPVYASPATQEIMENDANGFIAATKAVLGDDAPDQQPPPTQLFDDGDALTFGDVRLLVDEIGPGEADATPKFYAPEENALFTGDVVDNAMTPFMMEGHTREWRAQLTEISGQYADDDPTVFPGHGPQGTMALFAEQHELISWVHEQVEAAGLDDLADAELDRIVGAFDARFPSRPPVAAIPGLMRENLKAVAAELVGE